MLSSANNDAGDRVVWNQSKRFCGFTTFSAVLAFLIPFTAPLPVEAQTFYGTILGSVTDASGASVPDAIVTLMSASTQDRRTVKTDASGGYSFINLIPGVYRLEFDKAGFKRQTRDEVNVTVEGEMRVDVRLDLGDIKESVVLAAQTPLLQTDDTALSEVIAGRTVTDTPLNGRNLLNLVALVPSVIPQGNFSGAPVNNINYAWGNFQAGGGMQNGSATFLDGVPVNAPESNIVILVPTQDLVQEFRVETSDPSPEFGRFGGAVVNIT
jgi:hypothetical protein